MAFEQDHIGAENFGANAGENLTAYKGLGVVLLSTGVVRATGVDSGPIFVLMNAPASGTAVSAWGAPNVAEARAAASIVAGAYMTISTSAYFITGSAANAVGQARLTVASGGTFPLRLL